ncbi:TetR/AcrR family transcriptional regulator [Mycolicibacter heraklionensis]|uniref:TetR/AcrR family transcriptional regulator n=1 Tax=Mycolicibacter heraklionensis TaxID=512402 RepID=UPI0009EDCFF4|nr:TetR/AcrR family transcriptional regulator [Mycolicibacter heraklionensis]
MARDTRQAMVLTAVALLRERGADGITLDTLVSRSGAPRGSIYHHFPGGRARSSMKPFNPAAMRSAHSSPAPQPAVRSRCSIGWPPFGERC